MKELRKYDFTSPEKITIEHLRTLEIIHESFTREMEQVLVAQMGVKATVKIKPAQSVFYRDYVKRSGNSVYLVFSMPPLPGVGIIEIALSLSDEITDLSLGGEGTVKIDTSDRRSIPLISKTVLERTVHRILEKYSVAWERIIQIETPEILNIEIDQGLLRVTNANDVGALIPMDVEVNSVLGEWTFYLPSLMLENILDKLTPNRTLSFNQAVDEQKEIENITESIKSATVPIVAKLSGMNVSYNFINGLSEGDIIKTPHHTDTPIIIEGGKKVLANAFLGKVNGKVGFKIRRFVENER